MTRIETRSSIDVTDGERLHSVANRSFMEAGGTDAESEAWLGTSEDPRLGNCVTQIMGELPADCGAVMTECEADAIASCEPRLRTIVTACASTSHLTGAELLRIDAQFDIEEGVPGRRCREEIVHDGLVTNPLNAGFVIRLPRRDRIDAIRGSWTPEMTMVIDQALRQGAQRIEFHADEDETDGMMIHEH